VSIPLIYKKLEVKRRTSCNFNLDEVFDCPVPLVNLDPVWQKSPLSSFLGNDGITEMKANGGEAVQAEH
jgi:hypothetical protein